MSTRYYKYSYMTEAERIQKQREHDLALARLRAMTPREGKTGNPPYGLGILSGVSSRPYKNRTGTQTDEDRRKTPAERIAACKARVTAHIARINARTNITAAHKARMIAKLNEMLTRCSTPRGLEDEERDKEHKNIEARLGVIESVLQSLLTLLRTLFPQSQFPTLPPAA